MPTGLCYLLNGRWLVRYYGINSIDTVNAAAGIYLCEAVNAAQGDLKPFTFGYAGYPLAGLFGKLAQASGFNLHLLFDVSGRAELFLNHVI